MTWIKNVIDDWKKWIETTKKQMNSDETGKHKSRRETKEKRTFQRKMD